jgi:hypothetical protein
MYVPSPPVHLVTANGSRTVVEMRGDAHVVTSYGGCETMIVLKNAMYVPGCAHVLISGSLAHDAGLRQDLISGVMKTSAGEIISRLGFHKSRVLVLEGANAAPTAGHVRRLRECRRVDQRSATQWTDAAAPFAARTLPSSCTQPTSSTNKFATLSDSAVDVHDTYDESWCEAQQPVSRRPDCPADSDAVCAHEVVTFAVTRRQPAKDYAAMDTGRVGPAGGTPMGNPVSRPQPAKFHGSHAASAQHTSVRANRGAPRGVQPSGAPVRPAASTAPGVGGASAGAGAVARPRFPVGGAAVGGALRSASLARAVPTFGGGAAGGARDSAAESPTPLRPPPQPPPTRAAAPHRSAQLTGDFPRDGREPAPGGDGGALPTDHPAGYDDGNDDRCLTPEAWEMVYGNVLGGVIPTVDLFATRRNAHCAKYYTASTDAFKHAWVHESAHANPPFRGATAARAVVRGYTEWKKSPATTSFTVFLPLWEGAPHSANN